MTPLPILRLDSKPGVRLNLDKLLTSRLLVQGTSGAGKSWLLRYLLEQTHGQVQQIVIDREGEFVTLRDRYPYLLIGPGGDLPADLRAAKLLPKKLLELKVSALIDLSELNLAAQRQFVAGFLSTMAHARRDLWTDCLVIVDEAHLFAPEKGQSEAGTAIADLASLGRKRGFCLCLATTRLAKLSKDASAECLNKLVGRTASDDCKRALEELGSQVTDRTGLRSLDPGTFWAYGPAIAVDPVLVRSGPIDTKPPARGKARPPVPPAPKAIKAILGELADLPQQADEEARAMATMQRRIIELERELAAKPVPSAEVRTIERPVLEERVARALAGTVEKTEAALFAMVKRFQGVARELVDAVATLPRPGTPTAPTIAVTPADARRQVAAVATRRSARPDPKPSAGPSTDHGGRDGLSGPERRVLDALAWFGAIGVDAPHSIALAFIAGYKPGGAYNNTKGSLRSKGLIDYPAGGLVTLTDEGRPLGLSDGEPVSLATLHARVLERLSGPEQRVLQVMLETWPDQVTSEQLAAASGYSPGGAFNNVRGRLRTLGLIDYPRPGWVRAEPLLFPEGLT